MPDEADEPMGILALLDDSIYKTCSCTEPIQVRLVEGREDFGYCACGCPWLVAKRAILRGGENA